MEPNRPASLPQFPWTGLPLPRPNTPQARTQLVVSNQALLAQLPSLQQYLSAPVATAIGTNAATMRLTVIDLPDGRIELTVQVPPELTSGPESCTALHIALREHFEKSLGGDKIESKSVGNDMITRTRLHGQCWRKPSWRWCTMTG